MLKNISKLELVIENKLYQFFCDSDSQVSHVKEALFQFGKYVGQIEDNIKAASEKVAGEVKPEDPQPEGQDVVHQ